MRLVLLLALIVGCSAGRGSVAERSPRPEPASGKAPASEPKDEHETEGGSQDDERGGDSTARHDHDDDHAHDGYHHHDFSDVKRWVAQLDDPKRARWQRPKEVVALMDIAEGMTVADVGAGTGYFLPGLSKAVGPRGKVLGLDVEPAMVEHMTKRARRSGLNNVEARVVTPGDPGLDTASIDRLLIVNTWHHIDNRLFYSRSLKRALREEGRVFVVDYTMESPRGPPLKARLTAEQVVEELRRGGLQARVLEEKLPYQYVVEGR